MHTGAKCDFQVRQHIKKETWPTIGVNECQSKVRPPRVAVTMTENGDQREWEVDGGARSSVKVDFQDGPSGCSAHIMDAYPGIQNRREMLRKRSGK